LWGFHAGAGNGPGEMSRDACALQPKKGRMRMNLGDTALGGIRRPAICREAWTRGQFLAANGAGERLHLGKNNEALVIVPVALAFQDPAGQARFDFGVNPGFDQPPELLAKIRDLVQPGEFKGFKGRLGATEQVINVALGLTHVGSSGNVESLKRRASRNEARTVAQWRKCAIVL